MASYESDLQGLKRLLDQGEAERLSAWATPSSAGVRRKPEDPERSDYRQAFSRDVDRILHSRAYTRYIDKTQVFYLIRHDHITHRVLHVQLVSKIGRTIGRFLGLNQDLIEAIALGHDIGHPPFGHDGERFLSRLCQEAGIGHFRHNVQSVQFLEKVEKKGRGWNLCLQTLDGILCHDGEIHNQQLVPQADKDFSTLDRELAAKVRDPESTALIPMSQEACVVRFSDTIAYIGRDIEDAIRLNVIRRSDLPASSTARLGETNGTIVYQLVSDVIRTSLAGRTVAFSPEVSEALLGLKRFNYARIYTHPWIKRHSQRLETLFTLLFERYLADMEGQNRQSGIYTRFLADMSADYLQAHGPAEIVRDFIAGMTDRYFLQQCPSHLRPEPWVYE